MSSLEYRPIFLIVFTVVVFFFSSTFVLAHAEWYDDSWEYRKKITLSLNTVISNDLTDFPVLISVTDPDLVQTNEALGRDIVFTTSDGTTKLFHEVERFDNTTGEIVAWVNFPTLSATSTTDIYMYYKGNTVGYNSADVWNDDSEEYEHKECDDCLGTGEVENENHGSVVNTDQLDKLDDEYYTIYKDWMEYLEGFLTAVFALSDRHDF